MRYLNWNGILRFVNIAFISVNVFLVTEILHLMPTALFALEIKCRIAVAKNAFTEMKAMLTNPKMPFQLRYRTLTCYIIPMNRSRDFRGQKLVVIRPKLGTCPYNVDCSKSGVSSSNIEWAKI